jgi:transcriptional regulator with XRE-family HTH domain
MNNNSIEEKLGKKIARHRKAFGLTQARLAEKVRVHPETISRIETGSRSASLDLIAKVSDALKLELHDLFRLHDDTDTKGRAVDRLLLFASRLSPEEIELVMDVGGAMLGYARRERAK